MNKNSISFSTRQKLFLLPINLIGWVLGTVTILGWLLGIPVLLIHPEHAYPLSFPGAVVVLMGAASGTLILFGYRELARLMLLTIIPIIALLLLMNLSGFALKETQTWLYRSTTDPYIIPFRTTIFSLISGLLLAAGFYLLTSSVLSATELFISVICFIISLAITTSASYGYLLNISNIYVWFNLMQMSILSSITLTLYGLGGVYMSSYFITALHPRLTILWFPMIGSIGGIAALTALIISIISYQELGQQHIYVLGIAPVYVITLFISLVIIIFGSWIIYLFQKIRMVNTELAETINEKSLFLANMSHEIRSPLQAVLGTISLLSQQELNPKQEKIVSYLSDASHQLQSVINNVIDLTKLETGLYILPKGSCDIKQLAEEQIRIFSPLAEKQNIQLNLQIVPIDMPQIMIGSAILQPILTNLISNAIKYTHEGTVTVKIELEKRNHNHGILYINVSDTGVGIPKEIIPRLFKKFAQFEQNLPKKTPKGSGLGLYIVKLLVDALKGTIEVKSELNRGSTFNIAIPVEFKP